MFLVTKNWTKYLWRVTTTPSVHQAIIPVNKNFLYPIRYEIHAAVSIRVAIFWYCAQLPTFRSNTLPPLEWKQFNIEDGSIVYLGNVTYYLPNEKSGRSPFYVTTIVKPRKHVTWTVGITQRL
jgi:hypothetical protein